MSRVCDQCGFEINPEAERDFAWEVNAPMHTFSIGVSGPDTGNRYTHGQAWQCLAAAVLHRDAKNA